jgi:hypothetical protein
MNSYGRLWRKIYSKFDNPKVPFPLLLETSSSKKMTLAIYEGNSLKALVNRYD